MENKTNRFKAKAKQIWENHPFEALIVGGTLLNGTAKIIEALGSVRSKNAYAKAMNRSNKK